MGILFDYNSINTKIRGLEKNLLSKENYAQIAELNTISEAVVYLKRHPHYRTILAHVDETSIHRGELEGLLQTSIYKTFSKIYRFASLEQRKFLDLYFIKYEIIILKSCLRMVFDNRNLDLDLSYFQDIFYHHSHMDVVDLSNSATLEEMVSKLKGSPYFEILRKLHSLTSPTLFDYEMALDNYYFSEMWKKHDGFLKGVDLKIIKDNYGSKMDLLNIQWIFRSKNYYKVSASEIYSIIIPFHHKLRKSEVTALIESSSTDEFFSILENSFYKKHFSNMDSKSLEKIYLYSMNQLYDSNVRKYPYSIASINTYLYRKEYEIDRLTTLLEGIRYKLNKEDVLSYIM